eukprot:gene7480-1337_t
MADAEKQHLLGDSNGQLWGDGELGGDGDLEPCTQSRATSDAAPSDIASVGVPSAGRPGLVVGPPNTSATDPYPLASLDHTTKSWWSGPLPVLPPALDVRGGVVPESPILPLCYTPLRQWSGDSRCKRTCRNTHGTGSIPYKHPPSVRKPSAFVEALKEVSASMSIFQKVPPSAASSSLLHTCLPLAKVFILFAVCLAGIVMFTSVHEPEPVDILSESYTEPLEPNTDYPLKAAKPASSSQPSYLKGSTWVDVKYTVKYDTAVNLDDLNSFLNITLVEASTRRLIDSCSSDAEELKEQFLSKSCWLSAEDVEMELIARLENYPKPAVIEYKIQSMQIYEIAIAALVLGGVYVLIVFELCHRTIAAMIGSFCALGFLALFHERMSLQDIVGWIDLETVSLLWGMMIMVGILSTTGAFEFASVYVFQWSRGDVWRLMIMLSVFTAVVSAFLDNVTTMLLITPVAIRLCKILDIEPQPLLICMVIFSNIGGTGTAVGMPLVHVTPMCTMACSVLIVHGYSPAVVVAMMSITGDPPNVIIINHNIVSQKYNINFLEFTLHLAIGATLATGLSIPLMRLLFRKYIAREPSKSGTLERDLDIWRREAERYTLRTEEEVWMKNRLTEHIAQLEEELFESTKGGGTPKKSGGGKKRESIEELKARYTISNMPLFLICSFILTFVVLLFFLEALVGLEENIDISWVAIIGAVMMLIAADVHDLEHILHKVEWATLLFFAALFVLIEALAELGLITFIGDSVAEVVNLVECGMGRMIWAIFVIVWVSAITSAFIDNIPYTAAMIPVMESIAVKSTLPFKPLLWSLAFGTCLGGNGTLIGASANVVTAGLAAQQGYYMSFVSFFKVGFPTMLYSVFIAWVYLTLTTWWGWDWEN